MTLREDRILHKQNRRAQEQRALQMDAQQLPPSDFYNGVFAARQVNADNLGFGMIPDAAAARGDAFGNYYQGRHAGRDAKDNLGVGMIPDAGAARGDAFGNYYSGRHAGRDAKDNLGPGMIPDAGAARGDAFGNYWGGRHAGRDAKDNLGPGMIPDAGAARGLAFDGYYQGQHAGRDVKDNLGPGMIPDAGAARGLAFDGYYQGLHAGRDVKDNLGPGMIPDAGAARGLAFDGWYGNAYAGRDSEESRVDPPPERRARGKPPSAMAELDEAGARGARVVSFEVPPKPQAVAGRRAPPATGGAPVAAAVASEPLGSTETLAAAHGEIAALKQEVQRLSSRVLFLETRLLQ